MDVLKIDHTIEMCSISLSKCNKYLLKCNKYLWTGSYDITTKLIDLSSKTVVQTFSGHDNSVTCSIFLNKKGTEILTASFDNTLKLWNVTSGFSKCIKTFRGHTSGVTCVIYDEKSNRIYSSSYDKSIICWDVYTGEKIASLNLNYCVYSLCFIKSYPQMIASASSDLKIKIWDTTTNPFRCIKTLDGHTDWIFNIIAAPDGIHIISSGLDRKIKIWNTITGKCVETIESHYNGIWSLAISSCGNYIVSGDINGKVVINQVSPPFPHWLYTGELLINNEKNTINVLSDGIITVGTVENFKILYQLTVDDYITKQGKLDILISSKINFTTNSKNEQLELIEILLSLQNYICFPSGENSLNNIVNQYRFDLFQIINNFEIPRNILEIIDNFLINF